MGKGVIKTTGMPQVSPIVQGAINLSLPLTSYLFGTIEDSSAPQGTPIPFIQPFGQQMGIGNRDKVNFETVTINGLTIANGVRLLAKGTIVSINAGNDGGILFDKAMQMNIPFYHPYAQQAGLVAPAPGTATSGTLVNYETVIDPVAGPTAIALVII
jgi:hypothetical protein